MPTFDTPTPISATIDIPLGAVHLIASDRTNTVVAVSPGDPGRPRDVSVAQDTRIEYVDRRLLVHAPRPRGLASIVSGPSRYGSVEVVVELPAGSDVDVEAQVGDVRADGRLGEVRIKTAAGDLRIDDSGPARLETQGGTVTLRCATGPVAVVAAGELRVTHVDGNAEVKNLNGRTWVGEVIGDLGVRSSNGDLTIERSHGHVAAKTANGSIRLGAVADGSVDVATGSGRVEVGVPAGTAAWVDAHSRFGRVTSALDDADEPGGGDETTVEVRARTAYGDIVIQRA